MNSLSQCWAAAFLLTLVPPAAHADRIAFSWAVDVSPFPVSADSPGTGAVGLYPRSSQGGYAPFGDQYDLADSSGHAYGPNYQATFTDRPFTLTLRLTDGPSGASEALTFHGTINGSFDYSRFFGYGQAFASFSDGVRDLTLGHDRYHVALLDGPMAAGLDPSTGVVAQIDVGPVATAPEPSALLLAVLGLSPLCVVAWEKKKRRG